MSSKITYLLGAGASANALPTVKGYKDLNGKVIDGLSESIRKISDIILLMCKSGNHYKVQLK